MNHFLHRFIILLHLISSFLLSISSFVIFVTFASISLYFFLLLSVLNTILLTSSVNTLCFCLLNVCGDFDINLLFSYEFFVIFSNTIYINFSFSRWFIFFQVDLLLNFFLIFTHKFSFYCKLFCAFQFFIFMFVNR